jgi:hypothetical protein
MGTCKECRWWHGEKPLTFGTCGNWRVTDGSKGDKASAFTDMGSFVTGPHFGCIHSEAKEPPAHKHCWHVNNHTTTSPREYELLCCQCREKTVASQITLAEATCSHDVRCPVLHHEAKVPEGAV